ncbi:hypothetical protein [Usitatibacter rugosus]|nr:hypothetical protein [Usitatibacter rugosus]
MPGIAIALNNVPLATVSTEGTSVLTVRVNGDMLGPDFASLDVSGGNYDENLGPKTYLTWVHDQPMRPGDEIEVTLVESATTNVDGKTIDELFPDYEEPVGPSQPLSELFRDLAGRPRIRERFSFRLASTESEPISTATGPGDHSFGFSVLWDSLHPERARVSLSSANLECIEARKPGTRLADLTLHCGQGVRLRVDV